MLPNTRKLPTKYDIIQEYGGSHNVAHAFGEHADPDGYANANAIIDSILEQDVGQWQEEQEQAYRYARSPFIQINTRPNKYFLASCAHTTSTHAHTRTAKPSSRSRMDLATNFSARWA